MNTIPDVSSPDLQQRRRKVRRLFHRHHLSMLQIGRKLGISKPTVWRDIRWLAQHDPVPTDPLKALKREIEDAMEEAWHAYARSLEPQVVETEIIQMDALGQPTRVIKRVVTEGKGDVRFLELIGFLVEKQVKLFHAKKGTSAAVSNSADSSLKQIETKMKRYETLCCDVEPGLTGDLVQASCKSDVASVPNLKRGETEMKRFETELDPACNDYGRKKRPKDDPQPLRRSVPDGCIPFPLMGTAFLEQKRLAQAA